jgi:hypothetical protein
MAVVESIGDPTLTLGLTVPACVAKLQAGEMADALRWAQAAIVIADGDSARGSFMLGSPLAMALVFRGFARCTTGREGWREDFDEAVVMARAADPASLAVAAAYKYVGIGRGILLADDAALTEITEVCRLAERCSEDLPLVLLRMTLGIALVQRDSPADRARGVAMLAELRDTCIKERYALNIVSGLELNMARETANEDIDRAVQQARAAVEEVFGSGNFANSEGGTQVLVELLLARGAQDDLAEAEAAIERLAGALPGSEWVTRDISLLRLRALLAQTHGDEAAYRDYRNRYRAMANDLGFEGHMAWAAAMP